MISVLTTSTAKADDALTRALKDSTSGNGGSGNTGKSLASDSGATAGTAQNANPKDVISLSPEATKRLSASASASPTPSASGTKSFSQVTADARKTLDENLAKTGLKINNRTTGAEFAQIFDGLDRRSLFAIRSNSGGLFTEEEQNFARGAMDQMEAAALGLYGSQFLNVSSSDPNSVRTYALMQDAARQVWSSTGLSPASPATAADYLNAVRFLDSVSEEEKASDTWRMERASVQGSYENLAKESGGPVEDVDSGDPVVRLLVKATRVAVASAAASGTFWSSFDGTTGGIEGLDIMKPFQSELAQARSQIAARDSAKDTQE